MTGKQISHYRILAKLGGGGMGVVYKAQDTKLDRFVALKFLPADLVGDEEAKKRFIHEAQAASALDHPNICTIFEIGEEGGQAFIAMAFCEGETVKQMIEHGPLRLEQVLDLSIQAGQGLAKAHEKGIVHRDIKPANLMLTADGVLKILDFGLAKLMGKTRLTQTGTTLGTIAYMSPEQARGEPVDQRTDIWSLGVVLYEMLTGQLPFKGDYEQAIVYSVMNEDPEPPTALRTGVPMDLERVILKALAKAPEERYQHADEMLADLRRIQRMLSEGRKVPVGIGPAAERKWFASPILWTLIIVIFGLGAGVLLFYPTKTIPFSERDWVLITDFENLTGEEVFDQSLSTAFALSIGQSRYLNVLPKRRVREALRRMERTDVERLNDRVAREIAEREGVKVVLVPSIARVGEQYILTAEIRDVHTGASLKSHIVYARKEEEVVDALDRLSREIRKDLGEALAAISEQSKPLAKVTTSSLEALKQYSLGIEKHKEGKFEEAHNYYENALRVDSTLTAARASLGMLHFEMGPWMKGFDREKGKEQLAEVVANVDDLTDREKYGILAFYARAVENDLEKAAEYHQARLALYPDDSAAHNNLGRVYEAMGRREEAAAEYKRAIEIDPGFMLPYNSLANLYLYQLGEPDSARVWTLRQISRNPDHFWAYDHLGWAYFGLDSLPQAERAFERALQINPRSTLDLYRLAHALRLQGRYEEAIQPLQRVSEIEPDDIWVDYNLGILYQMIGEKKNARARFEGFRTKVEAGLRQEPENPDHLINVGLALAHLGEVKGSTRFMHQAMSVDSTRHFELAEWYCLIGKKQEALAELERAIHAGFRNLIWIKIHPDFQPLYDEPRFAELVKMPREK